MNFDKIVTGLLWIALLVALVGSFTHVSWAFATMEPAGSYAGYLGALAVDLGLLALAVGIQRRKRSGRKVFALWVGVFAFCGISAYANLLHGVSYLTDLSLSAWIGEGSVANWLLFARPLALSAVLPLLVLFLSEVAAADFDWVSAKSAEGPRKHSTNGKTARMDSLAIMLNRDNYPTLELAAKELGVSKRTATGYYDALVKSGAVEADGRMGW